VSVRNDSIFIAELKNPTAYFLHLCAFEPLYPFPVDITRRYKESFLSFLGLNVHPCTWGILISEGKDYIESSWWMILFPGMVTTTCLLCLNFFGDGLRDSLDKNCR
jgi:ABC-type microcin C transport system permease subunit YejE